MATERPGLRGRPKLDLFRSMIENPGDARRIFAQRNREIDPTPVGQRLAAEVLVDQEKARSIMTKRTRRIAYFPRVPDIMDQEQAIPEDAREITIFQKIARGRSRRTTYAADSAIDLDALYDPSYQQTIDGVVGSLIGSSFRKADQRDEQPVLTGSIRMLRNIFDLLAIVDRRVVGVEEVASAVVASLPPDITYHFALGEALDLMKNRQVLESSRAEAKAARKFEEVYLQNADKENSVYFMNGSLKRDANRLFYDPLKDVLIDEFMANDTLTVRRRATLRRNGETHISEINPNVPQYSQRIKSAQRRLAKYAKSRGGLETTPEELGNMYDDEHATFISYIDDSIDYAMVNRGRQDNPRPQLEFIKMFGRFFDQLTILRPDISYEAGVAVIIAQLREHQIYTEAVGEILTYIQNAQYPLADFYIASDVDGAAKFQDAFFKIMPANSRLRFGVGVNNYHINHTRGTFQKLVRYKGIERIGSGPYFPARENPELSDVQLQYPGESVN